MYSGGYGAEQDNVQAHKWFSIASELGNLSAPERRDDVAARMSADELAEAGTLASAWLGEHRALLANQ